MKDIARGFLVECTKQRIDIVAKPFNERWQKVQGAYTRYKTDPDTGRKTAAAKTILSELDDLAKSLDGIQSLAARYPDELQQLVATGKNLRAAITGLRNELTGYVGGK